MNIQETHQFIKAIDLANKAPLLEGVHGIGKSALIHQYAKANDMHCETIILSLMDTGDLCGLPRTAEVGGQLSTVWAAPVWFNRIVNAAWPAELEVDALIFKDAEFSTYVNKHLSIK